MEDDKKCFYDSISFYDGKDSTGALLGYTCGKRKITVQTSSFYLTVVFNADNTLIGGGFKLSWTIGKSIKKRK